MPPLVKEHVLSGKSQDCKLQYELSQLDNAEKWRPFPNYRTPKYEVIFA